MSLAFGTNNYLYIPHNAQLDTLTNAITIMCRVKFSAIASSGMFVNRMISAAPGLEWWSLDAQGTPVLRGLVGTSSSVTNCNATTAPALTTNVWYHMAMTYDGATCTVIQDAVSVGTASRAMTFAADTTGVVVGANAQAANDTGITEFLMGSMEDLRVYKRVLTLNEIEAVAKCDGRDYIYDGLLFRLALDEFAEGVVASGAGSVKDSGPYGMHATPYGSPTFGPRAFGLRRPTFGF